MPDLTIVNTYASSVGTGSTSPFVTHFSATSPTPQNVQFPLQKRWVDTSTNAEYILANFVTTNGVITAHWIELTGGIANTETLTGNSGGAVSPTSGNINVLGDTTTINIVGVPSTSTLTANVILPATAHSVLIGETSSIAGVSPDATSGIPLISKGTSSDPAYGTAVVAGGGTGDTSFTAYALIAGGTTSTGALQSISGVGTLDQVLSSNGAGALPTWKSISATGAFDTVNIQVITTTGTYTPTTGMVYCIVELVGGGGGGGGKESSGGATGGAGGGEYARGVFSASTVGASQSVTIGAGGTAGTDGTGADGTNGGTTSFGALMTALGGGGSAGSSLSAGQPFCGLGGTGGTGGNLHVPGSAGLPCVTYVSGSGLQSGQYVSGAGGGSVLGGFTTSLTTGSGFAGAVAGSNYGGGGGGGASASGAMAGKSGGTGASGICIVTEFISS